MTIPSWKCRKKQVHWSSTTIGKHFEPCATYHNTAFLRITNMAIFTYTKSSRLFIQMRQKYGDNRKGKLLGKSNPFILCKDTWYKTENGEAIQAGPPTRYWQQTAAAYL
jgi:hypothetical protein